MLESSKGSGNSVATMLSDADVAQLSRKHSRLVQQSARDPALAGETDFPRRFMTAVWSCVAWTASGVAPVTVSAEAACPAEHPLAIAVAPCPIRDSVISAANSVLLVFFSIRRCFFDWRDDEPTACVFHRKKQLRRTDADSILCASTHFAGFWLTQEAAFGRSR